MKAVAERARRRPSTGPLALLQAGAALLAFSAQAQTPACEQLKGALAKRLPGDVRSYSLEAVPADTPVAAGAKVIGTCESGAYKVVYRRAGVAAPAAASAASEVAPPRVPAARAAPKPAAPLAAAASAPEPVRPAPTVAVNGSTNTVAAASAAEPHIAASAAQLNEPAEPTAPTVPSARPSWLEFRPADWQWILGLAILPVLGLLWAWIAHRASFDKAGLPRGPRL